MSDLPSSIGIHELLRYIIPGYSFVLITVLPFVLANPELLKVDQWEIILAFFIFGGLVVGYIIFYLYYAFCLKFVYTPKKRRSVREAVNLVTHGERTADNATNEEIRKALTVQSRALEKHKRSERKPILFQFSIFHSIGALIPALLGGYVLSIVLGHFWIDKLLPVFWTWEIIILIFLISTIIILVCQYDYRSKLWIEIEDALSHKYLETTYFELYGKNLSELMKKKDTSGQNIAANNR